MIKMMSFYSGVRTRHVNGWVSIIWFTSAVSIAVSEGVELRTVFHEEARCGDNVTLLCEATLSKESDITFFAWHTENMTCQYKNGHSDPGVLCDSTSNTPHHTLTLTLLNVMPVHQGSYLCKLRSKLGVKSDTTTVRVKDCFGSSGGFIDKPRAECWFSGVYPSGSVHWFQGDLNLTDSASTQEDEDVHGRYNISSTIDVQKGNLSWPYTCSLWIPSAGEYRHSQQLHVTKRLESSGRIVKLQWICMMVGIMMVKFMT